VSAVRLPVTYQLLKRAKRRAGEAEFPEWGKEVGLEGLVNGIQYKVFIIIDSLRHNQDRQDKDRYYRGWGKHNRLLFLSAGGTSVGEPV
jgi:hypothetical protein